jgi:lipoprotein-releasing system permease protein
VDLLLLAWRYLVARPITLVSTLSVTVGLAAVVVVDSVMNGFLAEHQAMIRALAPDVIVDVSTIPPARAERVLAELRASDDVRAASPRVEVPAIHGETDQPAAFLAIPGHGAEHFVEMVGVDPQEAMASTAVVELPRFLGHDRCLESGGTAGFAGACRLRVRDLSHPFAFDCTDPWWRGQMAREYWRRDDLVPIVFGELLAESFEYRIGSVLTISTFAGDPAGKEPLAVRQQQFVVVGAFVTRDKHFDLTHALVPRDALVAFAALPTPMHEIAVAAAGPFTEAQLRDRLRARLAGVPEERIETWADRKSLLLGAVENERRVMNVAMFFVVIVATFSLFMTLHQMVRRKTRDIGVLGSLGAPPLRAGKLFLLCGLFVTVAGAILGFLGGLLLTHWLNPLLDLVKRWTGWQLFDPKLFQFDRLPIGVDVGRIGWYALATVVCGTLFTLLPSMSAARLDPVEALRHE